MSRHIRGTAAGTRAGHVDARARALNRARRVGYAALPGDAFSYVLHLRPREWPIMAAHTALGFVLAMRHPVIASSAPLTADATLWTITLPVALLAWVLCLNGGTLALNSAFDRDEGDIGYLDAPPSVPRHLALFGAALMVAGQGIAVLLPLGFAAAYTACMVLSLLYSVPPVRLKAVGGLDWVINMVGFGALTPYAGWAATGRLLPAAIGWLFVAFCPLFGALYPLTQLYQLEEDARRGDRTLAIHLGVAGSLWVAAAAVAVALACFARAAWLAGGAPRHWAGVSVVGVVWALVLGRWLVRYSVMTPEDHKRGMYAGLAAWAVSDAAVLLAFG